MTEYERSGLVFTKTRVYKFGHGMFSAALSAVRRPHLVTQEICTKFVDGARGVRLCLEDHIVQYFAVVIG